AEVMGYPAPDQRNIGGNERRPAALRDAAQDRDAVWDRLVPQHHHDLRHPDRRDAVRARLGDAVPGRRGHGRHRQEDGRGGGRATFRRRPSAKSWLTVAWMLSNPSLACEDSALFIEMRIAPDPHAGCELSARCTLDFHLMT